MERALSPGRGCCKGAVRSFQEKGTVLSRGLRGAHLPEQGALATALPEVNAMATLSPGPAGNKAILLERQGPEIPTLANCLFPRETVEMLRLSNKAWELEDLMRG